MPLLQQSYWFPAKKLKRASRKEASAWWNWRLWNLQVVRVNTHFPILQFSSKGGRRQGRSLKIYRERERERETKKERERERDTEGLRPQFNPGIWAALAGVASILLPLCGYLVPIEDEPWTNLVPGMVWYLIRYGTS
jgi:hypothetical protein